MSNRLQEAPRSPGVTFEVRRPAPDPSPLRTDVAGIIARTERGPMGLDVAGRAVPVRVVGRRGFEALFGEMGSDASGCAVRGYFENGGDTLWVVRIGSSASKNAGGSTSTASAILDVTSAQGAIGSTSPDLSETVRAKTVKLVASSEGEWANDVEVLLTLRNGATPAAEPMADLTVLRKGRMAEHLLGLAPGRLVEQVNSRSALVRMEIGEKWIGKENLTARFIEFSATKLAGGSCVPPTLEDYQRASKALIGESEPALLLAPAAWDDLGETKVLHFYADWICDAAASLDRLILVDPPTDCTAKSLLHLTCKLRCACVKIQQQKQEVVGGLTLSRHRQKPGKKHIEVAPPEMCAAAMYYPWLEVPRTILPALSPTQSVPPSGHVAGAMSRLDRERGAHHTPANVPLTGAVDLTSELDNAERAVLTQNGFNALRCSRGRGVEIWGGRTLDLDPSRRFLAHRRLVHRLVRAIRRTAEPLVFDSNTPVLRLMFVRAITSVLLEAFRAGALKGARPEEGFRVACDDTTHPPDAYETGFCIAEIDLAPAAPMEFIHLVIALSQDGSLQVLE